MKFKGPKLKMFIVLGQVKRFDKNGEYETDDKDEIKALNDCVGVSKSKSKDSA